MSALTTPDAVLIVTALFAATINGGVGYGFSSITVPVALLFFPNQLLNPALVLLEVGINLVVFVANWRAWGRAWRVSRNLLWGALPGVLVGSVLLSASGHDGLKLATYLVLLPCIVAQTAGVRWPIRLGWLSGAGFGAGVGLLYGATTISGPPLALFLNNQGLAKEDFRAGISLFRIVESISAAGCYLALGLFSPGGARLTGLMLPSVLVGLIAGNLLLRRLQSDSFRRLCMGLDGLLVGFGLSRSALGLHLVGPALAFGGFSVIAAVELALVTRYFIRRRPSLRPFETTATSADWDYPVALKLAGQSVLLVGGGTIAESRLALLLEAGAKVHLVAPSTTEQIRAWAQEARLQLSLRHYQPGDCRGARLVLSAVDEPTVSGAVAAEARSLGIWVNAADVPALCDFNLPSVGRRGPLTLAVSTSGLAPALARLVRQRAMGALEKAIGPEYDVAARVIGRLRARLPGGPTRARLFQNLLDSDFLSLLRQGRGRLARRRVRELARASALSPGGPGSERE